KAQTQDVVVGRVDRPQHVVPSVIRRRSAVVHAQPTIGGRLPTVRAALSTVRGAVVHVAGAVVHDDDTEQVFCLRRAETTMTLRLFDTPLVARIGVREPGPEGRSGVMCPCAMTFSGSANASSPTSSATTSPAWPPSLPIDSCSRSSRSGSSSRR